MKPTIEKLIEALKACASAHNVEFKDWSDENQLGLHSESVPVVSDARMIARAFFGNNADVEVGWGFTTVWAHEDCFLDEVDESRLAMALPYELIDKIIN